MSSEIKKKFIMMNAFTEDPKNLKITAKANALVQVGHCLKDNPAQLASNA